MKNTPKTIALASTVGTVVVIPVKKTVKLETADGWIITCYLHRTIAPEYWNGISPEGWTVSMAESGIAICGNRYTPISLVVDGAIQDQEYIKVRPLRENERYAITKSPRNPITQ